MMVSPFPDTKPARRMSVLSKVVVPLLLALSPPVSAGPITGPEDIRIDFESLPTIQSVDAMASFTAALRRPGTAPRERAAVELAMQVVRILRLNRLDTAEAPAAPVFACFTRTSQ